MTTKQKPNTQPASPAPAPPPVEKEQKATPESTPPAVAPAPPAKAPEAAAKAEPVPLPLYEVEEAAPWLDVQTADGKLTATGKRDGNTVLAVTFNAPAAVAALNAQLAAARERIAALESLRDDLQADNLDAIEALEQERRRHKMTKTGRDVSASREVPALKEKIRALEARVTQKEERILALQREVAKDGDQGRRLRERGAQVDKLNADLAALRRQMADRDDATRKLAAANEALADAQAIVRDQTARLQAQAVTIARLSAPGALVMPLHNPAAGEVPNA